MGGHCKYPSLIPFLSGTELFSLGLQNFPESGLSPEKKIKCFYPHYRTDALSVGYNGYMRGSSTHIKSLMFLVQRDRYPEWLFHSTLVTNKTIDHLWKQVLSGKTEEVAVSNAPSEGKECMVFPYAPLFYCCRQKSFFHPPCPRCGGFLQLCHDDELLEEFNMPQYSHSLRRYMYCAACTPLHLESWYAIEAEQRSYFAVKDCRRLLADFGTIAETVSAELHFACPTCPHHNECYGDGGQVEKNIAVFSFYPFYLQITECLDYDGRDFLAYLSGASAGSLDAYKKKRGLFIGETGASASAMPPSPTFFFSEQDPQHFFERLYLKLSFLWVIGRDVEAGRLFAGSICYPLLPHDIGVTLIPHASLPSYWNFSLSYPGLQNRLKQLTQFPREQYDDKAFFFALLWFVVLLINEEQDEASILENLHDILRCKAPTKTLPHDKELLFHPRQAYWQAGSAAIDERCLVLWDRVLQFGWELLCTGYLGEKINLSANLQVLEELRLEIRTFLLPDKLREQIVDPDDADIADILQSIKEKWEQRGTQRPSAQSEILSNGAPSQLRCYEPGQDERMFSDSTATLIISSDSSQTWSPAKDHSERTDGQPEAETMQAAWDNDCHGDIPGETSTAGIAGLCDDLIDETVIIRPSVRTAPFAPLNVGKKVTKQIGGKTTDDEDREATHRYVDKNEQVTSDHDSDEPDGDLETTVKLASFSKPLERSKTGESAPRGILEETILQQKWRQLGEQQHATRESIDKQQPQKKDESIKTDRDKSIGNEDDFLTETVVLKPSKRVND